MADTRRNRIRGVAWLPIVLLAVFGGGASGQEGTSSAWKRLSTFRKSQSQSGTLDHPEVTAIAEARDAIHHLQHEFDPAHWQVSHEGLSVDRRLAMQPAIQSLDKIAAAYSELDAGVRALFFKSELLNWSLQPDRAIEVLRTAASRYRDYPEGMKARIMLGDQLLAVNRTLEAVDALEPLLNTGAGTTDPQVIELRYTALCSLAEARLRAGHKREAAAIIVTLVKEYPELTLQTVEWYTSAVENQPDVEPPRPKRQPTEWFALIPSSLESSDGTTLTQDRFGWIEANGDNPETDTYTIKLDTQLVGVTSIMLEMRADDRLPHRGPGRHYTGNFVLTEFQATLGTT